jgi:membrane-associated phospholipid phosphatase
MKKTGIVFVAKYGVVVLGLVVFMYLASLNTFYDRLYVTIVIGGSVALSVTCAKILKRLFKQPRPAVTTELFTPLDVYAFPSGHTSGVTALVLALITFAVPFGLVASIIGLCVVVARVLARVHFTRDVVGGFVVASLMTYYALPYLHLLTMVIVQYLKTSFPT